MRVLSIFGFMQFGLADVLDIIMVALVIFLVFRWIRDSSASVLSCGAGQARLRIKQESLPPKPKELHIT